MKHIQNKFTEIKDSKGRTVSRADLLTAVLNHPSDKGITLSAMRIRIKVLDILEKTPLDEDIVLEDSHFVYVKQLFEHFGWPHNSKDILSLGDHLDEVSKSK